MQQPQNTFLHEVGRRHAGQTIGARDAHDEIKIAGDQPLFGPDIAGARAARKLALLLTVQALGHKLFELGCRHILV